MTLKMRIGLFMIVAAVLSADDPKLVLDTGGHRTAPVFMAFTRDGKFLVSVGGNDKLVEIWDIASGKRVRTIAGKYVDSVTTLGKINAAALSPDEKYLAVGGQLEFGTAPGGSAGEGLTPTNVGVIRIHDFHTGKVVALLRGHTDEVLALAFSPDGRQLASGSADNTIRLWSTAEWKPVYMRGGHKDSVTAVAFSPDSKLLVSGSDDATLILWDVRNGLPLKDMTEVRPEKQSLPVSTVAFSPDGRYIVSGGLAPKLWNGQSGALISDFEVQGVQTLVFSPDGHSLLATGMELWDPCPIFEVTTGLQVTQLQKAPNSKWCGGKGAAFSRMPESSTRAHRCESGSIVRMSSARFCESDMKCRRLSGSTWRREHLRDSQVAILLKLPNAESSIRQDGVALDWEDSIFEYVELRQGLQNDQFFRRF